MRIIKGKTEMGSMGTRRHSCISLTMALSLMIALLSGCDIFNKPLESFIQDQTAEVRVASGIPTTIPPGDSDFSVSLQNSQAYPLQVQTLNNGVITNPSVIWAEVPTPDEILVHFKGVKVGETFNLSLKIWIAGRNRVFDDLVIPLITCIPDITAPAEVGSLLATAGNAQGTLTWTDPTDSDFQKVVITYTNGAAQSVDVAKATQTATITGLTNGTAYTFTVKTVDTTGNTSTGITATATPSSDTYTAKVDGGGYVPSTKIDFVFSAAVSDLTASDITIGGTLGAATKGTLTGGGTNWSLPITVTSAGAATVAITKAGIESGAKPITLHKIANAASPDLSIKFGITTTGGTTSAAEVTTTFNTVHTYLAANPEVTGTGTSKKIGYIALGDYIDLVSLTIAGYPSDTGSPSSGYGKLTGATNNSVSGGKLLRLIVVGINSFNGINGNGTAPHLVFQFQNIPVLHRMNPSYTNVGGYAASEMRSYLTGNFRAGLTAAGVPNSVLWMPERKVSCGGSSPGTTDTIEDKLWLPTVWEMFGSNEGIAHSLEDTANQARLEYYNNAISRKKYESGGSNLYWLASPTSSSASDFCSVDAAGYAGTYSASTPGGCAPAFCVK
jgi:hypothetical protein